MNSELILELSSEIAHKTMIKYLLPFVMKGYFCIFTL